MSDTPDDPKLEELANSPDVQTAVQQLRDNGVPVSSFQDFVSEYAPAPTPNVANQPEVQVPVQQLRDSGASTFEDFITEYGGSNSTPNMEAAQQAVDRIPADQQLRNLDVKLDQPDHDNDLDR